MVKVEDSEEESEEEVEVEIAGGETGVCDVHVGIDGGARRE